MADQKSATELRYLVRNSFLYFESDEASYLGPFSFMFGMYGSHVEFKVLIALYSSFGDWLP